jgi:hypothetical protein
MFCWYSIFVLHIICLLAISPVGLVQSQDRSKPTCCVPDFIHLILLATQQFPSFLCLSCLHLLFCTKFIVFPTHINVCILLGTINNWIELNWIEYHFYQDDPPNTTISMSGMAWNWNSTSLHIGFQTIIIKPFVISTNTCRPYRPMIISSNFGFISCPLALTRSDPHNMRRQ